RRPARRDARPHRRAGRRGGAAVQRRGGRRRAVARADGGRGRGAGHHGPRAARPQPRDQPPVRVQRPRHVPRAGRGQPRAVRGHRGREGATMTAVAARPAAPVAARRAREIRSVAMHDPLVRPLLDELSHEYWTRYQRVLTAEELRAEMEHYPAHEFAAPHGDLVRVLEDGAPVAGGAFRRRTEPEVGDPARLARASARRPDGTPAVRPAELKRIWPHSSPRRRGLPRVVIAELERRAAERGYRRVSLATGYTPLFDTGTDPEEIGPLAFEKWLEVAP